MDTLSAPAEPEIIPILPGPPAKVRYVPATERPELLFDEDEERDVVEDIRALEAARAAVSEDALSGLIGARPRL